MPRPSTTLTTRFQGFISSFDGAELFVKVQANSDQVHQTIFLVHGLGGSHAAYTGMIPLLSKLNPHTQFVSYDLRVFGQSSQTLPTERNSIEEVHSRDLKCVIEMFCIGDLICFSQSWGSLIVQQYLLLPDLKHLPIKNIMLVSSLYFSGIPFLRQWLTKQWQPRPVLRNSCRTYFSFERYQWSWDYSPSRIWHDAYAIGLSNYLAALGCILGWRNPKPESLNSSDLVFIHCTRDLFILPWQQNYLRKMTPRATHLTLKANHNCLISQQKTLAALISANLVQYTQ